MRMGHGGRRRRVGRKGRLGDRGPLERARTWSSVIITTPGITAPPEESPRWLPPPISSRVRAPVKLSPDGCLSFFGVALGR